jgi:hypothetical protein
MTIHTIIFRKVEEFNWLQNKTQYFLFPTEKTIGQGKAKRLLNYAIKRMKDSGFPTTEKIEISTTANEGYYHVAFENDKGGSISVQGIMLGAGGWPCLDHGFSIEQPR